MGREKGRNDECSYWQTNPYGRRISEKQRNDYNGHAGPS